MVGGRSGKAGIRMRAHGIAVVTFQLQYSFGPVDEKWPVGELQRRALAEAHHAAQRVVAATAEHARLRLSISKVGPGTTVVMEPEERG
jgi:hypothetical protein